MNSGARSAIFRWCSALVVIVVLSGFALLLVTGQYMNDGPVILPVTPTHGLHRGDVFVIAGWLGAVLAVSSLASMAGTARLPTGHARPDGRPAGCPGDERAGLPTRTTSGPGACHRRSSE